MDGDNTGMDCPVVSGAINTTWTTYHLTPIDQTIMRFYVRLTLFFPSHQPSSDDMSLTATMLIRCGLEKAINRWPFLGGNVVGHSDPNLEKLGMLEIRYQPHEKSVVVQGRNYVLDFPTITGSDKLISYRQLYAAQGRTPFFTMSPVDPKDRPEMAWPPVTLKVTIVDDGLVLGFAFHHSVMDGPSIKLFLEAFAEGTGLHDTTFGLG